MKKLIAFYIVLLSFYQMQAQSFVTSGQIEYQVTKNLHKPLGNSTWANTMKETMPRLSVSYYSLTFNNEQSLCKFDRWEAENKLPAYMKGNDELNSWFYDGNSKQVITKKTLYGFDYTIKDSAMPITWKLGDEKQVIAGYTCRKATGIMFDSVYVFAFYTDELPLATGPGNMSGLPGTVLGLTIPRLYISWVATKVNTNLATATVVPPTAKKYYSRRQILDIFAEKAKEWGRFRDEDDDSNSEQSIIWLGLF